MRLRRAIHRGRATPSGAGERSGAEVAELERRLEHLESALEGLQDSVHREFVRQGKQLSELTKSIEPATLTRALSADARRRGV